ncbi:MAG: cation diffusion facilitator family transporter [Candidatus Ranarchaeia archaeon]
MVHRQSEIKRVLSVILGLNLLVALSKVVIGVFTNTLSMVADGIHSTLDGASNIIGLISIKFAFQPPDTKHQFGHRKFEVIAAFMVSIFLLFTTFEIIQSVVDRFIHPQLPTVSWVNFLVMLATISVNYGVYKYEFRRGRELCSPILRSDALHTKSDILVSFSVILGLVFSWLGLELADPLIALVVVLLIGKEAYHIFRENLETLVDTSQIDPMKIRRIAMEIPGVIDAHNIRTRGVSDEIFVDLHVVVDPKLSVYQGHDIATNVQKAISNSMTYIKEVYVHIEPAGLPPAS